MMMENKVKELRRAAGLTQLQLAKLAGCTAREIQKIEAGETLVARMTAKNALNLARALNIRLEELM